MGLSICKSTHFRLLTMKKNVMSLLLLVSLAGVAQAMHYSYSCQEFYSEQYRVASEPLSQVYTRYDRYGRSADFQRVRMAQWRQVSGGCNVLVQTPCGWVTRWQNGSAWQMNWIEREVRVR